MSKSIPGINLGDRVENRLIMEKTKIKKLKFVHAGHLYRSNPNHWGKEVLDWVPLQQNKKKKGRPPTRCRDEITKSLVL